MLVRRDVRRRGETIIREGGEDETPVLQATAQTRHAAAQLSIDAGEEFWGMQGIFLRDGGTDRIYRVARNIRGPTEE